MAVVYITSETHSAGKTMFAAALAEILNEFGKSVALLSSQILNQKNCEPDYCVFFRLQQLGVSVEESPTSSDSGAIAAVVNANNRSDFVIVDGTSQVSSEDHISIVESTDARVVVVSDFAHGLSCSDFAKNFGTNLEGIVVNFLTFYGRTEAIEQLIPKFDQLGISVLGLLPEDRTLLSLTVDQVSKRLGGEFFAGSEYGNNLVVNFMVGAFGMDPGEYSFSTKEKKAVIVRGDRPDVQMSALGTDMECLILTNGLEPIEYVKYESVEEEVSIVIVDSDTLQTMENIGSLQHDALFDHVDKLESAKTIVSSCIDVPAFLESL